MLTKKLMMYVASLVSRPGEAFAAVSVAGTVSGGSIHAAYRLNTSSGSCFIKCTAAAQYPGIFATESNGLQALRNTNAVKIPRILGTGEADGIAFLLLEYLNAGKRKKDYFEQLGRLLAQLHQNTNDQFGLDHDNYIGSLPQQNNFTSSGCDFMIERRFRPLVKMALGKNLISAAEASRFDNFYKLLPELLPDEKPALLHGDLWNGNVITGPDGCAWLIDPAVYYGYRETDLAMAKLFGGFDESFYESYNETFPLQHGWEERTGLFQLYPLLVHLNLFGRGYVGQVKEVLKRYG